MWLIRSPILTVRRPGFAGTAIYLWPSTTGEGVCGSSDFSFTCVPWGFIIELIEVGEE